MKKLQISKASWIQFGILNVGIAIVAAGVYFFKFPNHFVMGGVSALSVLLAKMFPLFSPGTLTFILNMVLMLVGFLVFGKGFGMKTAYASVALSGEIWLLERLVPMSGPFTQNAILELVFAIMLPAVGSALLFNINASTGGTDVVAMILKKYSGGRMNIGYALLFSDLLVTLAAFFVFDVQTGLLSILGLSAKALMVDAVIENINTFKYFTIVTTQPQQVSEFIMQNLHRGGTAMIGHGIFTQEEKSVFLCVVNRPQAVALRDYVRSVDPKAFVLITNTSQIIGKGFRGAF